MDSQQFDRLVKGLASGSSRRTVLKGLFGGAAALVAVKRPASADNGVGEYCHLPTHNCLAGLSCCSASDTCQYCCNDSDCVNPSSHDDCGRSACVQGACEIVPDDSQCDPCETCTSELECAYLCDQGQTCCNDVCAQCCDDHDCDGGDVCCGGYCQDCCYDSDCVGIAQAGCGRPACWQGSCVMTADDSRCGPCETCDPGDFECTGDCENDQVCCWDVCAECCDDTDCPSGECCGGGWCSADYCEPICKSDKDCDKDSCCCKNGHCSVDCCKEPEPGCKSDKECGKGTCCCQDGSCSAKCCEVEATCKGDGDCGKGTCCCKNGSCGADCCPAPPASGGGKPAVKLPTTGAGSDDNGQAWLAGAALLGGAAAIIGGKLKADSGKRNADG